MWFPSIAALSSGCKWNPSEIWVKHVCFQSFANSIKLNPYTMWGPIVISWFMNPSNSAYSYHKPKNEIVSIVVLTNWVRVLSNGGPHCHSYDAPLDFGGTPQFGKRQICLIGGFNPSEKYKFVNWDDYSQLNGKIENVPNHQRAIVIFIEL